MYTAQDTIKKKTRNKETETQTYKLDAKEYGVFVGGGEGVSPPLTPLGQGTSPDFLLFHCGYSAY